MQSSTIISKVQEPMPYPLPNNWSSGFKLQNSHNILPIYQWLHIPHFLQTCISTSAANQNHQNMRGWFQPITSPPYFLHMRLPQYQINKYIYWKQIKCIRMSMNAQGFERVIRLQPAHFRRSYLASKIAIQPLLQPMLKRIYVKEL